MLETRMLCAAAALLSGTYTAVNVAIGGEPAPLVAVLAVVGLLQYVVLD